MATRNLAATAAPHLARKGEPLNLERVRELARVANYQILGLARAGHGMAAGMPDTEGAALRGILHRIAQLSDVVYSCAICVEEPPTEEYFRDMVNTVGES